MKFKRNRLVRKRTGLIIKPNFRYFRKARKRLNRKIYRAKIKVRGTPSVVLAQKYRECISSYKRLSLEKLKNVRNSHGKGYRILREVIGIFKLCQAMTEEFKDTKYNFRLEDLQSMLISLMPFARLKQTFGKKGSEKYKADVATVTSSMYLVVRWIYVVAMEINKRNISLGVALTLWDVFLERGKVLQEEDDYYEYVYSKETWNIDVYERYRRHVRGEIPVFAKDATRIWWKDPLVRRYRRVFVLNMKLFRNTQLNIIRARFRTVKKRLINV